MNAKQRRRITRKGLELLHLDRALHRLDDTGIAPLEDFYRRYTRSSAHAKYLAAKVLLSHPESAGRVF